MKDYYKEMIEQVESYLLKLKKNGDEAFLVRNREMGYSIESDLDFLSKGFIYNSSLKTYEYNIHRGREGEFDDMERNLRIGNLIFNAYIKSIAVHNIIYQKNFSLVNNKEFDLSKRYVSDRDMVNYRLAFDDIMQRTDAFFESKAYLKRKDKGFVYYDLNKDGNKICLSFNYDLYRKIYFSNRYKVFDLNMNFVFQLETKNGIAFKANKLEWLFFGLFLGDLDGIPFAKYSNYDALEKKINLLEPVIDIYCKDNRSLYNSEFVDFLEKHYDYFLLHYFNNLELNIDILIKTCLAKLK